ncbi:MAG: cyclic nucleotide-binding domain-containing protein [Betaproteobacteria bacterium]|nr:MAG: cyclic nucleotide-binding domain-containing protein [Betaproteobacteria bacterium]
MSLDQEVEMMRQIPLFSRIAPAMQKLLCFGSERLTYDPGQVLVKVGDMADAAYVIIEGQAEVSVPSQRGTVVVNTMGKNEVIGEIAIFVDLPRTATVTAITKVEVLRISKDLFINVVRQNPDAAIELIRILAMRLVNTTQQLIKNTAGAK